jgi:serine/threonine protein kinase
MPHDFKSPELEELGLLIAEASRNVAFVIGAGLSMPAGVVGWERLNEELLTEATSVITHDSTISPDEKARRLSALRAIKDPWILGDELASCIPRDRYIGTVRKQLTASASVPDAYKAIWRLNPSGVVSFNLDRLCEDALNGTTEQVASPDEEAKYLRFLLLNRPFLFQPHGRLADPKTWVLGLKARNRILRENTRYREWIGHLLSTRRLVIVGFRPRDFSFESLLLNDFRGQLTSRRVDHFWIVPDPGPEDTRWAEQYRLKVIPYSPSNDSHPEVLSILQHLSGIAPRDPRPGVAYVGTPIRTTDLPPDDELRKYPLQDIRARLNAALKGETELIPEYDRQLAFMSEFMKRYGASVHMAWHMKPGTYDTVWGYRISKELGKGGFGYVWMVEDVVDGQVYAMKVLHESVIDQPGFLEAFRRGVRAMRILDEGQVDGMVKYRAAFDIPACVVMEHIDGIDFETAIQSRQLTTLDEALEVVNKAGSIVLRGHNLDKQVLHRDLKPANVMLRSFYDPDAPREVVVLDFDLSWYEGALGRSLLAGAHLHNYVAPEQVSARPGVSSRHTAVDVFGLGMLLFFAATGKHPEINAQNAAGFRRSVEDAIRNRYSSPWQAIPLYLSLAIEAACADAQAKRPPLTLLVRQIEETLGALRSGKLSTPSDLANLEIASPLLKGGWQIAMTIDTIGALSLSRNECTVNMGFCDSPSGIVHQTHMTYSHSGGMDWSRVKKYGRNKRDRALAILRHGKLFEGVSATGDESISIEAVTQAGNWSLDHATKLATAIAEAANALAFVEG